MKPLFFLITAAGTLASCKTIHHTLQNKTITVNKNISCFNPVHSGDLPANAFIILNANTPFGSDSGNVAARSQEVCYGAVGDIPGASGWLGNAQVGEFPLTLNQRMNYRGNLYSPADHGPAPNFGRTTTAVVKDLNNQPAITLEMYVPKLFTYATVSSDTLRPGVALRWCADPQNSHGVGVIMYAGTALSDAENQQVVFWMPDNGHYQFTAGDFPTMNPGPVTLVLFRGNQAVAESAGKAVFGFRAQVKAMKRVWYQP